MTRDIILLKHQNSVRAEGSSTRQTSALPKTFFPHHCIFLSMFSSFEAEKQSKVDFLLSLFIFQCYSLMTFCIELQHFPLFRLHFLPVFLLLVFITQLQQRLCSEHLNSELPVSLSSWYENTTKIVLNNAAIWQIWRVFQRQSHNCNVTLQQMQLFHLYSIKCVSKCASCCFDVKE